MAYTFRARVRYSECDSDGILTPFSIVNYMQDCSTFQSEHLGLGVDYLKKVHRAWLLSAWHIIIDRYPRFGETIEAGTFAYEFKGIYGMRRFFLRAENGDYLVRADSLWFQYDTEHRLPVKPEEAMAEPYLRGKEAEDPGMPPLEKAVRKLPLPKGAKAGLPITVLPHFLDSNQHVNNARYIDLAEEAAGAQRPREIEAAYQHAAVLGDVITPYVGKKENDSLTVNLAMPDGKPYAVVRLGY